MSTPGTCLLDTARRDRAVPSDEKNTGHISEKQPYREGRVCPSLNDEFLHVRTTSAGTETKKAET